MKAPERRRLSDRRLASFVTVKRSPIHGRGLFAVRDIARGAYIGTFYGPRADRDGHYVLWVYPIGDGEPEGRQGKNCLRFLNHSQDCNAEFDDFDLYARRRITAGEEVTIDYGF